MTGPDRPVEFHRMHTGGRRRIGRGILAILLLLVGSQLLAIGLTAAAALADAALGTQPRAGFTPLTYGAGMVSVALLIPWSMLIQRWLYGQPGGSLSSVRMRFRFEMVGRALVVIGPAFLLILILQYWVPLPQSQWAYADVIWLLAIALLLAPLQAAGEEYGYRGLILQAAGSWSASPRVGLVVGIAVSSVLFALVHFSTSGWLNLWYVLFAVGNALISWRTGGIEVAVVIHALYNTLSFVFDAALGIDPAAATDRSADAAGVAVLLPAVVVAAATVVVLLHRRERGPALTAPTVGAEPAGADRTG